MYRLILLFTGLMLFFTGCRQEKKNESVSSPMEDTPSHVTKSGEATPTSKEQAITFEKDSPGAVIKDQMNGLKDSRTYTFTAPKGKTLYITIRPETAPANIRVKQIISPSGVSDGPFGIDVNYKITESGTWKIIVDESNMNGEEFKGNFMLSIALRD